MAIDWDSDNVTVGIGEIVALPWISLFLLALALVTARSVVHGGRPAELLGRRTMILAGIAMAAVAVAGVAGIAVSSHPEADGYARCDRGYAAKLGIVHWVRGTARCPSEVDG